MPKPFRAKFRVSSVTPAEVVIDPASAMAPFQTVKMFPVCRSDSYPADGSDEDNQFAKWSPSGSLELSFVNPNLSNSVKEGDVFYVDFTPVSK